MKSYRASRVYYATLFCLECCLFPALLLMVALKRKGPPMLLQPLSVTEYAYRSIREYWTQKYSVRTGT